MSVLSLQLPVPQDSDPEAVNQALSQAEAHRRAGSEENTLAWLRQAESLCMSAHFISRLEEIRDVLQRAHVYTRPLPADDEPVNYSAPILQVDDLDLEFDDSEFQESPQAEALAEKEETIEGLGPSLDFSSELPSLNFIEDDDSQDAILIGELSEELPEIAAPDSSQPLGTKGSNRAREEARVAESNAPLERSSNFEELDDITFSDEFGASNFGVEPATTPLVKVENFDRELVHEFDANPLDLDPANAAEFANASVPSMSPTEQNEIEAELGIDLSLNVGPLSASQSRGAPTPAPPSVFPEAISLGSETEMAPAAPESEPVEDELTPKEPPRLVMDPAQPFGMAPSALLPETIGIEKEEDSIKEIVPPSRPSVAPLPNLMQEPNPSYYPTGAVLENALAAPTDSLEGLLAASLLLDKEAEATNILESLGAPQAAAADVLEPAACDTSEPVASEHSQSPVSLNTMVGEVELMNVEGLGELPEEDLRALTATMQRQVLQPGEEASDFSAALVLKGEVKLMPLIMDASCATARQGQLLFTQGTMKESVALRVVAAQPQTEVALIAGSDLEKYLVNCPWVADELRIVGDRFQALAGALVGPLGESLDEMFREMVLAKCSVKRLEPGEFVARAGKPVDGFYLLGAGGLKGEKEVYTGDILFPETVLSGAAADSDLQATEEGALVLFADRMSAHELLATCPPFLELLGSA